MSFASSLNKADQKEGLDMVLRPDLQVIAQWIPQGSKVLDLGCGEGELL
ncbi:MAG: Methionine biosynthesis protein MetW, partial [Pseudomonadota bacterium]